MIIFHIIYWDLNLKCAWPLKQCEVHISCWENLFCYIANISAHLSAKPVILITINILLEQYRDLFFMIPLNTWICFSRSNSRPAEVLASLTDTSRVWARPSLRYLRWNQGDGWFMAERSPSDWDLVGSPSLNLYFEKLQINHGCFDAKWRLLNWKKLCTTWCDYNSCMSKITWISNNGMRINKLTFL